MAAVVLAGLALLSGLNPAAGRHPPARIVLGPGGRDPDARAAAAQQCADPYPATRDPANSLDLPTPPGANPLNGASFFVDGPRHCEAAGAIAQLLGRDPTRYRDNFSWATFQAGLRHGRSGTFWLARALTEARNANARLGPHYPSRPY